MNQKHNVKHSLPFNVVPQFGAAEMRLKGHGQGS